MYVICVYVFFRRWGFIRSFCFRFSFWGVWYYEVIRSGGGVSILDEDRGS